jgi:hypothetical protein
MVGVAASASLSGRHLGTPTTPGSTSSTPDPVKNAVT